MRSYTNKSNNGRRAPQFVSGAVSVSYDTIPGLPALSSGSRQQGHLIDEGSWHSQALETGWSGGEHRSRWPEQESSARLFRPAAAASAFPVQRSYYDASEIEDQPLEWRSSRDEPQAVYRSHDSDRYAPTSAAVAGTVTPEALAQRQSTEPVEVGWQDSRERLVQGQWTSRPIMPLRCHIPRLRTKTDGSRMSPLWTWLLGQGPTGRPL